jgi:phospholipid-binding lipoprotein MlaA
VATAAIIALFACANPAVAQQTTAKAVDGPPPIDNSDALAGDVYDPIEGVNRVTSDFNSGFRKYLLDPIVDSYKFIMPGAVQNAVSNMASNLTEPLTIVSSLLQLDFENAGTAAQRFVINSTFGFAGMGDMAQEMGFEQRKEDLGQALAVHGIGPGPHFVVPILGPSNLRDLVGDVALAIASPMPLAGSAGQGVVQYSDQQEEIRELGKDAIDGYIVERNAYEQNRLHLIANGKITDAPEIEFVETNELKSVQVKE